MFTHTGTIRGQRNVPLRREGFCWWAKYQVALGIVWAARDVTDLVELAEPIVSGGAR